MDDRLKALVLGGISWNTMVYLDAFPEPKQQTVFARDANETVGSSGAGKAMNLAHLGVDVTLWGLLGEDPPGPRIREEMAARGIRLLTETDPLGTSRHVNLMDAAGDRISIFVNPGSDDLPVAVEAIADEAAEADIVAVTIVNHCRRFLPVLRDIGKPVWIDLHGYDGADPHHAEFIEAADYLLMSSTAMADWRGFLAQRVAAGTEAAVCTHGASGASGLSAAEGWVDVPAVPVTDVVDTNGAGDAFFAGFATAWVTGSGLEAAMESGATTAAEAVQSYDLAPTPER
jgi:sugar/nucleoside kinase (ribokinase family)